MEITYRITDVRKLGERICSKEKDLPRTRPLAPRGQTLVGIIRTSENGVAIDLSQAGFYAKFITQTVTMPWQGIYVERELYFVPKDKIKVYKTLT